MRPHFTRLLTAACTALLLQTTAPRAEETIKVGLVMPMTGELASNGRQIVAGAKLYMAQHGETIGGKTVKLLVKDDSTDPQISKRLTEELIINDKINLLGVGITAGGFAIAPLVTRARLPSVIMLAGASALIEKSPYFVRTSFTLTRSSVVMAAWARQAGIAKVVTIVSDFAPGHEAEEAFTASFTAAGGTISDKIRVPMQNPDLAPFLQRAHDAGAQAIFVFVPAGQGGAFAQQFAERGLAKSGIRLIGPGDLTDDDILATADPAIIGTVTAHFYSAAHDSAMNKAFVADFEAANHFRPNFLAVSGYDGMAAIYQALAATKGSVDPDALIGAMKGMAWESPRGPMSIDPRTRDVVDNIYMREVKKVGSELFNEEFKTYPPVKAGS